MSTPSRNVFGIPELLLMILECITEQDESYGRSQPPRAGVPRASSTGLNQCPKATFARLARVCKTFSGPALGMLWRHIESFVPLIKLLPCARRHHDGPTPLFWVSPPIHSFATGKGCMLTHFAQDFSRRCFSPRLGSLRALRCVRTHHGTRRGIAAVLQLHDR